MSMSPEEIRKLLLYRDGLILVLNKPSGIAVHSGTGKGGNLEQYFDDLSFGLPNKPALAHRLDKGTSGCLVLGRHPKALRDLGKLFEQNKVNKTYQAIVYGAPAQNEGIIDLPLAPQSSRRSQWWMKVDIENGKPSLTKYKVLKSNQTYSLLELTPITGRTHQLRVHCAAINCPILGDNIYGKREEATKDRETNINLHLHALSIEIPLYPKKSPISVTAPLPMHMNEIIEKLHKTLNIV